MEAIACSKQKAIDVAAAIIQRGSTYLLTERKKGDFMELHWEFPGGKKKPKESLEACLARELNEELGINAKVNEKLGIFPHEYEGKKPITLHVYFCSIIDGEPYGKEGNRIGWYSLGEIKELDLMDVDQLIFEELLRAYRN
jgi:mutator protein MutT